jgi:hypothetical protein
MMMSKSGSVFVIRASSLIHHSLRVIRHFAHWFVIRHSVDGNFSFHGRSHEIGRSSFPSDRCFRWCPSRSSSRHLHFRATRAFSRWNACSCYVRSASGQGFASGECPASHHFYAAQNRVDSLISSLFLLIKISRKPKQKISSRS